MSAKVFSPISLVHSMSRSFWFCRSALTAFAAASLVAGEACTAEKTGSGSLWPIPPLGGVGWKAHISGLADADG